MLSRALEAEPMSVILWILYLLIFYSNMKSLGKDDMFSYAVCYYMFTTCYLLLCGVPHEF